MGLRIFEYRSKKLVDIGYKKLRKENNLEYLINLSNSLAKIPISSRHNIYTRNEMITVYTHSYSKKVVCNI